MKLEEAQLASAWMQQHGVSDDACQNPDPVGDVDIFQKAR
jgi:hypothetical protein